MFRLVASDLDGTLLNAEHRLSKRSKSCLERLHQHGIHFAFATGRHHLDVAKLHQYVGIPAFMVTSNGACIHAPDGSVIYQNFLDEALCAEIIALFENQPNIRVHLYNSRAWLCSDIEPLMAGQNQQTGFTPERFDIRKPPLKNILKIFVTCGDPAILEQYAHLGRQRFADDVTLTSSGKHFLEFNAKQDSKGNALRLLANQLNVELKHTLAFGDSMNDLSMLKAAGCSLVTSNADPRLTKAMPGLKAIGHHADDAVARYLTSYLNSELVLEND